VHDILSLIIDGKIMSPTLVHKNSHLVMNSSTKTVGQCAESSRVFVSVWEGGGG
jgi:hypothetical protein